jgi:predicted N-acetyltransferase YhbS
MSPADGHPADSCYALRPMAQSDIAAGLALCRTAGWNQRRADWDLFHRLNPAGCFVAETAGAVVGTVTTVNYADTIAWVAMVLVDPAHRRRGLGGCLLRAALDALSTCACVRLDATPDGKRVYDALGFEDESALSRMVADAAPVLPEAAHADVRPMRDADVGAVAAMDRDAFGADRSKVLDGFRASAPEYALVAERDGALTGFCLGRHGHNLEQVGPVNAVDMGTAQALVSLAFRRIEGKPALIDVLGNAPEWLHWLGNAGFVEQRSLVRMRRGRVVLPPHPERTFAISGPELG